MDWLTKILGGNIGELFSKVVGTFKLSPEKAAELEALRETHAVELQKLQLELESKAQDLMAREVEAASLNIRAEIQSDDKFTRRWRPLFGYMCTVLIFWNFALVPIFKATPVEFPDALFQLFGAYLLMAVGARTWEKIITLRQPKVQSPPTQ